MSLCDPTVNHNTYTHNKPSDGSKYQFLADVPSIEHIESLVMWKGLTFNCRARVLEIHRAFKTSLEEVLQDQISRFQHKVLEEQLAQSGERREEWYL